MTSTSSTGSHGPTTDHDRRRVGVLGHGAIGSVVARALSDGTIAGATLAGIARSAGNVGRPVDDDGLEPATYLDLEELVGRSDLIVEAAGPAVVAGHGPAILDRNRDLLIVSTGALADRATRAALTAERGGRLYLNTGAIGGVDLVRAVAELGAVHRARITTTKAPAGLVQDRMSPDEVQRLRATEESLVLFEGGIPELVRLFPSSTNVAATLALAVGSWDVVTGRVVADPAAVRSSHVIDVEAEAGSYHFAMTHRPSASNPRSSAVVPWAVVRSLQDLCGPGPRFI